MTQQPETLDALLRRFGDDDGEPSEVPTVSLTDALRRGDDPLCPDRASRGEGVTPEQLLIVLDQLLHDAARAMPPVRDLWAARRHVASALAAERRRLDAVRA